MDTGQERSKIIHTFAPFAVYLAVSGLTGYALETVWLCGLKEKVLTGAGPSYTYAANTIWACLNMVIPAGAGCLSVYRTTLQEMALFSRRACLEDEHAGKSCMEVKVKERQLFYSRILPLLYISSVFCSLSLNVLLNLLTGSSSSVKVQEIAGGLPGVCGILLQAFLYGIFMPFAEELVFRVLLFVRVERNYGTSAAFFLSAALFGAYHGNLMQGIYAFAMGLIFAFLYKKTGLFAVPFAIHGSCNLAILFLLWTGRFEAVCRPAWCAVFSGIAAGGILTAYKISRRGQF